MDQHEFARQFAVAYPRLWYIATSLVGNRADAEDLIQDAAVVAFRRLDSFETGSNFPAWLARIVRFCAANHLRKSSGRRLTVSDPGSLEDRAAADRSVGTGREGPGATDRADISELVDDQMLRVINQLTPEVRACLMLRVVDERSYAEIAQLLDIPAGTAMSHVHRAKQRLRAGYRNDSNDPNDRGDRGDRAGGSR